MIQDARACSTHPAFVTNQTHSQNAGALVAHQTHRRLRRLSEPRRHLGGTPVI
jgi:hypothetical protein